MYATDMQAILNPAVQLRRKMLQKQVLTPSLNHGLHCPTVNPVNGSAYRSHLSAYGRLFIRTCALQEQRVWYWAAKKLPDTVSAIKFID